MLHCIFFILPFLRSVFNEIYTKLALLAKILSFFNLFYVDFKFLNWDGEIVSYLKKCNIKIDLKYEKEFDKVILQEHIKNRQRVEKFTITNSRWCQEVSSMKIYLSKQGKIKHHETWKAE